MTLTLYRLTPKNPATHPHLEGSMRRSAFVVAVLLTLVPRQVVHGQGSGPVIDVEQTWRLVLQGFRQAADNQIRRGPYETSSENAARRVEWRAGRDRAKVFYDSVAAAPNGTVSILIPTAGTWRNGGRSRYNVDDGRLELIACFELGTNQVGNGVPRMVSLLASGVFTVWNGDDFYHQNACLENKAGRGFPVAQVVDLGSCVASMGCGTSTGGGRWYPLSRDEARRVDVFGKPSFLVVGLKLTHDSEYRPAILVRAVAWHVGDITVWSWEDDGSMASRAPVALAECKMREPWPCP